MRNVRVTPVVVSVRSPTTAGGASSASGECPVPGRPGTGGITRTGWLASAARSIGAAGPRPFVGAPSRETSPRAPPFHG